MFVYSSLTRNFVTLDEVDGVLPNEYLFQATLLAHNGDVFLGGTMGMTVINSGFHLETEEDHTVELLDVLLNGLPVPLSEKREKAIETIRVPWDFSSLQLKVLLNEGDVFRKNFFRFNIEGIGQDLANFNSNSLVINYLPIGEYTITASYYTRNGGVECETADSSCRGCFPLVEEQLVLCGVMYIGGNSSLWHYFLFLSKKESQTEAGDSASEKQNV